MAAVGVHLALWALALPLAYELRFDGQVPLTFLRVGPLVLLLVVRLASFQFFDLFRGLWRHFGLPDFARFLAATTLGSVFFAAGCLLCEGPRLPRSVFVGEWMISVALVAGARLVIRAIREWGPPPGRPHTTHGVGSADPAVSLQRHQP